MSRLAAITATRGLGVIDQWVWGFGFGAWSSIRSESLVLRPDRGAIRRHQPACDRTNERTKDIGLRTDQERSTKYQVLRGAAPQDARIARRTIGGRSGLATRAERSARNGASRKRWHQSSNETTVQS